MIKSLRMKVLETLMTLLEDLATLTNKMKIKVRKKMMLKMIMDLEISIMTMLMPNKMK